MPSDLSAHPILSATGVTVTRVGDAGPVDILKGIDLEVEEHTLTDIIGPSGAGKTTLLLALARLIPGATGTLLLRGQPAAAVDPKHWRSRIAYLPQRSALLAGSVAENMLLPWRLKIREHEKPPATADLRAALDRVHLEDVALDRPAERLSEGQAARVALLRTVLTRPDVLLLDEPDASLDEESATQVSALTHEFVDDGGAVVRVRHIRSDELSDRRLRLFAGELREATS